MELRTPTPKLLREIGKRPEAYIMFVLVGVAWFFIFKWTGASSQNVLDYQTQIADLKKQVETANAQRDEAIKSYQQVLNDLLVKNGIINDNNARIVDSILRGKLENETKTILQNSHNQ